MNYARSLTIHLRDMDFLASKHPNVHEHFSTGRFVAHETQRAFSGMPLDQAHEQLNALVKGDGGAMRLTENPTALRRWMVAGPEISRMIQEFESNSIHSLTSHHDQSHNSQITFKKDVEALVNAFCDLGNPFLVDSGDLMTLDPKDIMDEEVAKSIRNAHNIGQEQYTLFVQERFHNQKKNISDPIKKNKLLLYNSTYYMLYTRLAMYGVKHYYPHQIFLIHHFGDGGWSMETSLDTSPTGHIHMLRTDAL